MIKNPKGKGRIVDVLIKRGEELLQKPREELKFTTNESANRLLNDLENYPHVFVLACVMDRQIKAERAWIIPYKMSLEIGGFKFSNFSSLSLEETERIFEREKLHRFNNKMAKNFYLAIQKIEGDYEGDASLIWKGKPKSASVVQRFLEFKGVGVKIATMAANSLAREFKIPLEDYICIDISPDVHVKRVFKRLGFVSKDASNDELIYCARELNPKYPGVFDLPVWQIGRNWCHPRNPSCDKCELGTVCPKLI